MKYRRKIYGLGAIDVLSVTLYHAGFIFSEKKQFEPRYLGFNIFLSISGYLITSKLPIDLQPKRYLFKKYSKLIKIFLAGIFCPLSENRERSCLALAENGPLYNGGRHISRVAADKIIDDILQKISDR